MAQQIKIDPLTFVALKIECQSNGSSISTATAFVIQNNGNHFLITNWHVVSGCNAETNKILDSKQRIPENILVWHHARNALGQWKAIITPLFDANNNPIWKEHPKGREVDVVAIPFNPNSSISTYPLDLSTADSDLIISPSEPVAIIGFPLGQAVSGKFPIWKTGHVASDIDLQYQNKPVFLIDATTKPAMSGSPVIARRVGFFQASTGQNVGGSRERFLGVYSGRTDNSSDIGMVWKPTIINEILAI